MNRSYSKKRHIQEANEKLEKRFLNEDKWIVTAQDINEQVGYGEGGGSNVDDGEEKILQKGGFKAAGRAMSDMFRDWYDDEDEEEEEEIEYCNEPRKRLRTQPKPVTDPKLTSLPEWGRKFSVDAYGKQEDDGERTKISKVWNFQETEPNVMLFTVETGGVMGFGASIGELQYKCDNQRNEAEFRWFDDLYNQATNCPNYDYAGKYYINQELADFIRKNKWCGTGGAAKSVAKPAAKSTGGSGSKWDPTCDGEKKPFKKMCKGETIRKVQGCLKIKADSYFGSGTEAAVKNKLGRDYFTNQDINTLCDGTSTNTGGGGAQPQIAQTAQTKPEIPTETQPQYRF